jgi:predicted RND superfamily exporter protein
MSDLPPDPRLGLAARVVAAVAAFGTRRPWLVLAVGAVLFTLCAMLSAGLPISTSRFNLVSPDNPHQARLLRFYGRFGYPDAMVLVVRGGTAADRERAVEALASRLEQEPSLRQRVLGRIGPEHVAELLLLYDPRALSLALARLPEGTKLAEIVEGGLPRWISLASDQLSQGLGPDAPALPGTAAEQQATIDSGLRGLGTVLSALDAQLAGDRPLDQLALLGRGRKLPEGLGVGARGFLEAKDGSYHLIALFPDLPGAEVAEVKPTVTLIRRARDEVLGAAAARGERWAQVVHADLTGLPALATDELDVVHRSLAQVSAASVAALVGLLLLAFRSFRYALLSLIPIGMGTLFTLAVVRLGWGQMNLITSNFTPVLLGLGNAFAIIILGRYGEFVRAGRDPRTAISEALGQTVIGLLIASTTTVVAFLSLGSTEFTAYAELGIVAGIGLLLLLGATTVFMPPMLWTAGRGKLIRSPELPGLRHIVTLVRRGRWPVLAGAVAVVVAATVLGPRVAFNSRYFDFLPKDTESGAALLTVERGSATSPIEAGVSVAGIEAAREVTARLRALPSGGAVQTASDLLPPLTAEGLTALRSGLVSLGRDPDFTRLAGRKRPRAELVAATRSLVDAFDEVAFALRQAGRDVSAATEAQKAVTALARRVEGLSDDAPTVAAAERALASLLERAFKTARRVAERGRYEIEDLPAVFRARFAARDGKALGVYVNPKGDIWDRPTAQRFSHEVLAAAPGICGTAIDIFEHQRMIRDGFTRATLASIVLVFVIVLAGFRRVGQSLVAHVPLVLAFATALVVMGVTGVRFDVANVVTLPLIFGIGIDAGGHMINRYRLSMAEHGVARLEDVIRGTGGAVIVSSCSNIIAFAALMFGDYGAMWSLGFVMTIAISASVLSAIVVLPSVLLVAGKVR